MISREIALRQAGDDSVVTDDRGELPPVQYIGYNQVQNNVIQNNLKLNVHYIGCNKVQNNVIQNNLITQLNIPTPRIHEFPSYCSHVTVKPGEQCSLKVQSIPTILNHQTGGGESSNRRRGVFWRL